MNKTILTAVLAFVSATVTVAKTNISVTTNKTQLVMQVKDNGRLYQTYFGARLTFPDFTRHFFSSLADSIDVFVIVVLNR